MGQLPLLLFLLLYYWATCRLVSIYWPQCIVAKRFHIQLNHVWVWRLLVGKRRGANPVLPESYCKMTVYGIISYLLCVPYSIFVGSYLL